jgi:subtilisin family serine protease
MKNFKKYRLFLIIIIGATIYIPTMANGRVSPSLARFLNKTAAISDSLVPVILFAEKDVAGLKLQKTMSALPTGTSLQKRHQFVIENLKVNNLDNLTLLKDKILGIYPAANISEYWIASALSFKIPASKLAELNQLVGVSSIIEDGQIELIDPVESLPAPGKISSASSHLNALNIPTLWNRGLKGKGRLVCSFDTGVEGSHPAIKEKYRGNNVSHQAAWFAPNTTDTIPTDKVGHGTHTMGIMVGNNASDSFGVAPEAEWITAAVIDQGQTLSRTISDILVAFQWAVDPDGDPATVSDMPDVICNSWGVPTSIMSPCDETFNDVIDNVEAAGIVTIFAAGNDGPNPQTLRLPANRATTALNSFSVGSYDDVSNVIAASSSRGPSSCDTMKVKPEVVAPGVSIYSSYKGGTYRLMSGTSMAAPYMAGLVALLRQYNPDATVAEIKNAIIKSARDLGATGEDNTFGYGFPDAGKAIQYLPLPVQPEIYLAGKVIGGDGIANPGETFDLYVRLNAPAGNLDSLSGILITTDSMATIISSRANFLFGPGAVYSANIVPFVISLNKDAINGRSLSFTLILNFPNSNASERVDFQIITGIAPNGNIVTHTTSQLEFSVSDFGQYGFGESSIYSAGGVGFKYKGSFNLLYEAGIIVGRNSLQISSAVRDSIGNASQSDFSPVVSLSTGASSIDGSNTSYSEFVDTKSNIPIPIAITQSISSYDIDGEENYLIIKYYLKNKTLENITDLYFGFLTDFDLSVAEDRAGIMNDLGVLYQSGGGKVIGILPLTSCHGMITIENIGGKFPLTGQQKIEYIKLDGVNINDSTAADFFTICSFGPFNIKARDSIEVALAVLAGDDSNSIADAALNARRRFNTPTDINDGQTNLPGRFDLCQNYPNPFNPSTVIEYSLAEAARVSVTVYNILGQEVIELYNGRAEAGNSRVVWNATNDHGQAVPSGIYFYELKVGASSISKKMLLLK